VTELRAAIAVAFLSVPGFGFIAGINITDKNMREIGFLLGTAVQQWHIGFFIRHRWMVVLIGGGRREPVFARALTTPIYSVAEQDGEFAISIEGAVRDCCYAADRTLLYLAFTIFHRLVQAAGEEGDLDDASPRGV
jgi:hypothetical protein